MATKKKAGNEEGLIDYMKRKTEEERAKPLIATNYAVYEKREAYDDWDDVYHPAKTRKVSPDFDSRKYEDNEKAARDWIAEHDPDDWHGRPTKFVLEKTYLRTHVENRWGYV